MTNQAPVREVKIALLGVLGAFLALIAATNWRLVPSAYIHMFSGEPLSALARAADANFAFVNNVSHYDGVYYYAIGIDPLATSRAHQLIDQAPYRYGHPLHGWLAYLLSFGNSKFVPLVLVFLSLAGVGVGIYYLSKLAMHFELSPWLGLLFIANPGIYYAAINSTTETIGMALVVTFLYFVVKNETKAWILMLLSIFLCLDKEQYVILILTVLIYEIAFNRKILFEKRMIRLISIIAGIPVLSVWYVYIKGVFHVFPNHYQTGVFGAPFVGWIKAFKYGNSLQNGSFDQSQIGSLIIPVLFFFLTIYLFIIVHSFKNLNLFHFVAFGQIAISLCQGWVNLIYPHEILREQIVSLSLSVLTLVLAQSPRIGSVAFRRRVIDSAH